MSRSRLSAGKMMIKTFQLVVLCCLLLTLGQTAADKEIL